MSESEIAEAPLDDTPVPQSGAEVPVAPIAASEPQVQKTRGSRGCGGIVIGVLLVLIGIPMLICPGPGMAVILSGLGMIGVGLGLKKGGE
ncbi:MAG: hypothetical protein JXP37_00995 [Coriobacteriia bacterium]|nr:hypothetical protein [Coriobacteriia bacterium]